ncbi:class I SAM-dependent methyltransferase [Proteobacteria bacterium 005FR1]|nr:class I SAM-dependent methyltransferase [Proteobacteria bacterium 005FR1]
MNDPCHPHLLEALNRSAARTLWIVDENMPADFVAGIRPRPTLYCVTNRFDLHRAMEKAGLQTELSDFDPQVKDVEQVIYRISKERALVHHSINIAASRLATGGEMIMFGCKNEGVKTNFRHGEQAFGVKCRSKKLGLCYEGRLEKTGEPTQALSSDDYPDLRELQIGDLNFVSKPGIFGWNKVDHGSELLIAALQENRGDLNTSGAILDLGCGWGYLLLATRDLPAASRVATDNNIAAVTAARENFRRTGLEVTTTVDDCGSQLSGPFDLILCNPAFHQGFAVSEALSRKFISQSARLLARKGSALLVVNQFVPLEKLAAGLFKRADLLLHTDGFKVFALSNR